MFWAVDVINGFNFTVAVSFRGTIERARWIAAFAQAQAKHPFLNVSVNQGDPQAPYFTRGEGLPIPLTFERRTSPMQWQRVMESEFAEVFDLSTAPLLRAMLLEDDEGCDLVLTANHVIIDGIGVLGLVRDLLAALSGAMLARLPDPPPAEDRVANLRTSTQLHAVQNGHQTAPVQAGAENSAAAAPVRTFARRKATGKPTIAAVRFSKEETALLLRRARAQQTTAGAALLAAMAAALRTLSPAMKEVDLHMVTPVDARPYLGNENDFVLSIGTARAVSPCHDTELWANARALKSQLAPFQSFAAMEATFGRVEAALALKLDALALVDMLIGGFGHDVLLSNLRNVELPPAPDGLTVDAVWGPSVLLGVEGEQMIGAATFGGALHLVYTSFSPVTGLLETVQQMIADACVDA
jgi:hypothetical protein